MNLLWNLVNLSSLVKIDTTLAAMPPPILLDPIADGDDGATTVCVRCTVYVPPPFVPILVAGKLSLVKFWHRLWGALVTSNLEADFRAFIYWLQVALVCSAPRALSPLLASEPTSPFADAVLMKHRHSMLIRNLSVLNLSPRPERGFLITTNIGYLVSDQRAMGIEAEALHKCKEDKGWTCC